MNRALISVGCDNYEHVGNLQSAELDATNIFNDLMSPEIGEFDNEISRLILSPTSSDFIRDLKDVLLSKVELDSVTIYFAGHGHIEQGNFYLCLSDTNIDQIWASAVPLTTILMMIAGAKPRQANIVLDACFSGGLVADLGTVTKGEIMGDAGTMSVTLLAMSAQDRGSAETPSGGIGTAALLECVAGSAFVNDASPSLTLAEIGQVVCDRVRNRSDQEPRWFAMNHSARSVFCKNPNFRPDTHAAVRQWSPRTFVSSIEPILTSHAGNADDLIADVERLSAGLLERAQGSRDIARSMEILATRGVALLEYASGNAAITRYIMTNAAGSADAIRAFLSSVSDRIEADRFCLLSGRSGLADLFYLPIRISKIIGWIGTGYFIDKSIGRAADFPREAFQRLLHFLGDTYGGSVSGMSDSQAPYIVTGLLAARDMGLIEEAELLLSLMFNSVVRAGGKIADGHLESKRVLAFLTGRLSGEMNPPDLVANPTELVTCLLMLSDSFGLSDTFDVAMENLDHLELNAYIADDYYSFGRRYISGGNNASFTVGHDIWTVADLITNWPAKSVATPPSIAVRNNALLASMLFPDRVPWFLFQ